MKRIVLFIILPILLISCKDTNSDSPPKNDNIKNEAGSTQIKKMDYKIYPMDESKSDPSLVAFISDLKSIVSNQDTSRLFQCLDSGIIVSHGGGIYGIKEFSNTWNLAEPGKTTLWKSLSENLKLGGTWEKDGEGEYFCIPYAQSNKAFDKFNYDFDWYTTAVCISPNAIVLSEPKLEGKIIGSLKYDVLQTDPEYINEDFVKIETLDGKIQGYVKTSDIIYSANGYLTIRKVNGGWKITSYAPFD